jgi:hypothetical protein
MTNAICGLRGHLSSPSAALEQSLVSKLKRRLDGAGSTLFSLTWKRKATPAGRPYYQLAASARRTSETGFGSWPTPDAAGFHSGSDTTWQQRREAVKEKHGNGNGFGLTLGQASQLAAWPTPNAMEGGQTSRSGKRKNEKLMGGLVGWPTPSAQNGDRGGQNAEERMAGGRQVNLQDAACLAAWATPRVSSANGGNPIRANDGKARLEDQVFSVSGPTPSGSLAPMEKPGQLDPDHSRWLMGYSSAHLSCAPTAMPSSRKRVQSS